MKVNRKVIIKEVPSNSKAKPKVESSRRDLHIPPRNQWDKSVRRNSPYARFMSKYGNLECNIDKFNSQDLVFYFRECAKENGQKYYIANISKDAAIFKRLSKSFDNREICGMIEFLFTSEQDYLEKNRLSPNVLASQWVNTIYEDYKLWVDDRYFPKSCQNKGKQKREWGNAECVESSVGGWE